MPAVRDHRARVGESITEGILARWLKPDGASVKAGEPLFELETDKATSIVPAPSSGVLKIAVAEGETVAIGATVAPSTPRNPPRRPAAKAPPPEPASAPHPPPHAAAHPSAALAADPAAQPPHPRPQPASGAALISGRPPLVAEQSVDLARVAATGPAGGSPRGTS